MIVLAESNNSFIIEVDRNEIAILSGFNSKYDNDFKLPKKGDDIPLEKLLNRIQKIESSKNQISYALKEAEKAVKYLRAGFDIFKVNEELP